MKEQTNRPSRMRGTLVMMAAMFAGMFSKGTGKTKNTHVGSMGWGSGAIFTPRRGKFKGYMRTQSSFNKNR